MNLHFQTKIGGYWVDFPFQTPTNLSYALKRAETVEEQIAILKRDATYISEYTMQSCIEMLNDNNLELVIL